MTRPWIRDDDREPEPVPSLLAFEERVQDAVNRLKSGEAQSEIRTLHGFVVVHEAVKQIRKEQEEQCRLANQGFPTIR